MLGSPLGGSNDLPTLRSVARASRAQARLSIATHSRKERRPATPVLSQTTTLVLGLTLLVGLSTFLLHSAT